MGIFTHVYDDLWFWVPIAALELERHVATRMAVQRGAGGCIYGSH